MAPNFQWPTFNGHVPLSRDLKRNQIRLLDLKYEELTKQVSCQLIHYDLGQGPASHAYSAMSYYWGSPGRERGIRVDGVEVMMRESVYDFLEALGRRFGTARIWLDVLCINQNDAPERNQQVALMRDIFARAETVYSWLGKGDADSDLLLDTLEATTTTANTTNSPTPKHDAGSVSAARLLTYARRLLAHPYFTRVWIIQECAVAKKLSVICGPKMVERRLLIAGVRHLEKLEVERHGALEGREFHSRQAESTHNAKRMLELHAEDEVHRRGKLLDVMDTFSGAECQDSRDKIFGFRGLAREGNAVPVDYTGSLARVFLKTLAVIHNNNTEGITSHLIESQRLLKHLRPTVEEVRLELRSKYIKTVSETTYINFKALIDGPYVASNENEYMTTHDEYWSTTCVNPTAQSHRLEFFGSDPLKTGDLIYRFAEVGRKTLSVALVLRSDENNSRSVADLGFFGYGGVNVWSPFPDRPDYMDDLMKLKDLCIPGGLELCKKDGGVHFDPVMLFASLVLLPGYWTQGVWSKQEAMQIFEMLKAFVEEQRDVYRHQMLCCCIGDGVKQATPQ